jgi:hypothetical protein
MRSKGVLSLKCGDIEIVLGSEPADAFSVPDVDIPQETLKAKVGKDGLTYREQFETYGRAIDAQE